MATKRVYRTMREDTETGIRTGKCGKVTYYSRYKKGGKPAKRKVRK